MVMVEPKSQLMTTREVAKELHVSTYTVLRLLKRGWISGVTLPNGTKRILRASVELALKAKTGA